MPAAHLRQRTVTPATPSSCSSTVRRRPTAESLRAGWNGSRGPDAGGRRSRIHLRDQVGGSDEEGSTGRRTFLATCALAGAAAARPLAAFGQAVDKAKQASTPSALRITDVKCGYVRGSLFVKIHTNQGIWGCGEAVDAIQGTYHLVQSFGQRLRDQNPLNVHRLFEQIRKGGVFAGAQSGMFIAVLSAVETALWDLAGKALNVPVYQLLGGKFRDRIRVYWTPRCIRHSCRRRSNSPQAAAKAAKRIHRDQVRSRSGSRS